MLPGETILLTLRLPGTLPPATARALAAELRQAPAAGADYRRAQKVFFAKFDAALDRAGTGARHFEDEKIAAALAGEFMLVEETGFVVHGFAILPGHAHLVLHLPPGRGLALAKALDLLHARSAAACRRLVRPRLAPDAPFWQGSWHDYPVADAAELTRILAYVGGQARQAGLPQRYQKWPYAASY
ncbi:hypothetical protein [Hymenobacter psoromatis]|uniref:hypothetical protein n=1 Tax=Hymenobacter psoromatis TaxID=1484116 RepID=UPI001CBDCCE0|nr:hypothetical protein [Hymenobacter psoromatis]